MENAVLKLYELSRLQSNASKIEIKNKTVEFNKELHKEKMILTQNVPYKMHWAVHRHTAAELIVERANAETEFEKYRIVQDRIFMYDYDTFLLDLEEINKESD